MPEAQKMSDVHERVGKLEQEMHTVKHQVLHLERLPPRVGELERAFEGLAYLRTELPEIKQGLRQVSDSQMRVAGDIEGFGRAIKWIGGLVTLAAMATAVVVWVLVQ